MAVSGTAFCQWDRTPAACRISPAASRRPVMPLIGTTVPASSLAQFEILRVPRRLFVLEMYAPHQPEPGHSR